MPSMTGTPRFAVFLLWMIVICLAAVQVHADPAATTTFDRWYVLQLDGEHAGYSHISERRQGDRILTETETSLTVRRGDQAINVEQSMWFLETEDGQPLEASSTLRPGALAIVQHYRFTPDGVEVTTGQGAAAQTVTHPRLGDEFLPPAAAQRLIEQHIAEGQQQIRVGMIDISMGLNPLKMEMKVVGRENVEVLGKVVPAVVWEATASNLPGITVREYVDSHGRAVKSSVQFMPGMDITMIEADEQLAKARVDPPRIMAQTLIRPDRRIDRPRTIQSAVYRLTLKASADEEFTLPRTGYQRVVWENQHTAAVVVDLSEPVNPKDDLPMPEDRESSDMIDYDSPAVRDLLAKALKGLPADANGTQVAKRLRTFVHQFIDEKDLSVGLARASEVAQTGQGDCTEHAVLLTALLRAKGIPARTVTGVLYIDRFLGQEGVFGYHMWTQAWLTSTDDEAHSPSGGRWVDLDAVLDGRDYDAAHIALAVSSMSDGQLINDLIAMLPTFGRLDISVVETH
ncbi:MAG: hypothetical protein Kow00105_13120 [Phycisphaeraceae bacterium]